MSRIIGIDPGLTGAVAIIGPDGTTVEDLPVVRDGKLAWIDGLELEWLVRSMVGGNDDAVAYVERVGAHPVGGFVVAHSQGLTLGSVLAVLQFCRVPVHLVPSNVWKRAMGVQGDKDEAQKVRKQRSLDRARLLFPNLRLDRAKDHNRAEALLLAAYGQAQQAGRAAA